jgi:hypothetical protein
LHKPARTDLEQLCVDSLKLSLEASKLPQLFLNIRSTQDGEILLEIIMRRYENRSTMMTSNRPVEEWGKLLCDVPAASAILDRLLHHAEIIAIAGRSYRLREGVAEQNQRQASQPKKEKSAAPLLG